MRQNIRELLGSRVVNAQGDVGLVKDFYFDTETWIIRYAAVETGEWLAHNHIMVSTEAFEKQDAGKGRFILNISRDIIRNSPDRDKPLPIPLEYKNELARFREWPVYYTPASEIPRRPELSSKRMGTAVLEDEIVSNQMLNVSDIAKYRVIGSGSTIARAEDLVIDDIFWDIRYIAAALVPPASGRILVSPGAIDHVDPSRLEIVTPLLKENVRPNATYDMLDLT